MPNGVAHLDVRWQPINGGIEIETQKRSQVDWLEADTIEIRRIIDENADVLKPLADWTDKDAHARQLVVTDLFWQTWYHAMAVPMLMRHELEPPLSVVQRTIFESTATLVYLVKHDDSVRESVVFLAASYLKDLDLYSSDDRVVVDRRKVLAEMPKDLVDLARRRIGKHPWTWSGMNVRDLVAAAGMKGYDTAYRMLSRWVHAGGYGQFVCVTGEPGTIGTVSFGRFLSEADVESHANLTRRNLHSSFRALWGVFDGGDFDIRVDDPFAWLDS